MKDMDQGSWNWRSTYGYIFVFSILGSLVGQMVQLLDSPGKRSLQIEFKKAVAALSEREESDLAIIKDELRIIFNILSFNSSERISLYIHQNQSFVMIGRYSSNPDYDKRGRGIHEEDQGVIGRAWREGEAYVNDLPACDGVDDFNYLRDTEMIWRIDRSVAQKFVMKSRTIGAYAISDIAGRRAFVLVFESMQENGFSFQRITDLMVSSRENERISLLLDKLRNVTPVLNIASSEGF